MGTVMARIPKLTRFISSPADVDEEHTLALRTIERLRSQQAGRIVLESSIFGHERRHGHFSESDRSARLGRHRVVHPLVTAG